VAVATSNGTLGNGDLERAISGNGNLALTNSNFAMVAVATSNRNMAAIEKCQSIVQNI
jgi:hypothetical protein